MNIAVMRFEFKGNHWRLHHYLNRLLFGAPIGSPV